MATFNQQGQHVAGNQYNANTINFGDIQSKADFAAELNKIKS